MAKLSLKWRVWWTWFAILLATIVVIVGNQRGWWLSAGISRGVVDELTTALTSFLFIGFFANLLFIRSVQEGLEETVRETLPLVFTEDEKKSIFHELGSETRATIVQQVLRAQVGPRLGQVIYSEVVEDYLKKEQDFRRNTGYSIRCWDAVRPIGSDDPAVLRIDEILRSRTERYLWVGQAFTYLRDGFQNNDVLENLRVQFVFTMSQLEASVQEHSLFFREVINVEPDVIDLICQLEEAQLYDLIRSMLQFEAKSPVGQTLEIGVEFSRRPDGSLVIEVIVPNYCGKMNGAGCWISFVLPHLRDTKHFVVTMPRPTEQGAQIYFEKSPSMKDLSEFLYLSDRSEGHKIEKIRDQSENECVAIKITTTRWMFPISGVIFFWK